MALTINKHIPFNNPEVAGIFDNYQPKIKRKLKFLRQLIFYTASKTKDAGDLEETIRWKQPSYITSKSKSGSTIRIDRVGEYEYAMYFHCQTNLVNKFREMYPADFRFEGNRAIIFNEADKIPIKKLSHCIKLALTYQINKLNK